MKEIELPDGSIAEFPDNMPDSEIEAVLRRQFQPPAPPIPDVVVPPRGFSTQGIGPAAASMLSGAIAEPIAGLSGILGSTIPGEQGTETGARAVRNVREALTFDPGLEGRAFMQGVINQIPEPIRQIGGAIAGTFKDLENDIGVESPLAGAAVATLPTAAELVVSAGTARAAVSGARKLLRRPKPTAQAIQRRMLSGGEELPNVPTISNLKAASRALYDQLDAAGVTVKPQPYRQLVAGIIRDTARAGMDPVLTPKARRALEGLQELMGRPVGFQALDIRRKRIRAAASDLDPTEAALGTLMLEKIDDFLDNASPKIFTQPVKTIDVGTTYRTARQLWGRAKRSELIEEAFYKARNVRAGDFETALRGEFRSILRNKKHRQKFSKEELSYLERVSNGDFRENMLEKMGAFGLEPAQGGPIVRPVLGSILGGTVGGTAGAVAIPLIGTVSRRLAKRMMRRNAFMANAVIRAGGNPRKIASAYLQGTPRAQRIPQELGQLLAPFDVDHSSLRGMGQFTDSAIRWAEKYRDAIATAAVAGEQGQRLGPQEATTGVR